MRFDILSLIICWTSFVYFVDSYPDAGEEEYKDGRPPKWTKTSTKRLNGIPHVSNSSKIQGRIVGGTDVELGALPYQVAISIKEFGQVCGGTIYNENFVISAAHCLFDDNTRVDDKTFEVLAGTVNMKKNGEFVQRVNVAKTTAHPDYDTLNGFNDVSIFKLAKPLKFNEYVRPLRIATKADAKNRQDRALVSGWGYTQKLEKGDQINDDLFPDTLKVVDVLLVTKSHCEQLHRKKAYKWAKHPSFMCAGQLKGGRDSCQGDSGGPLACFEKKGKKFHCGVVANGVGCARADTPGFYTDVSYFHDWIVKLTGPQRL